MSSAVSYGKTLTGKDAERMVDHASEILVDDKTSMIKMIRFKNDYQLPANEITHWLNSFQKQYFGSISFKEQQSNTDRDGYTVKIYDLYSNGYKVEYGILKFHIKDDKVYLINGELYKDDHLNIQIKISLKNIDELLERYCVKKYSMPAADKHHIRQKLLYKCLFPENNRLIPAAKCELLVDGDEPKKNWVYVSLADGKILFDEDRIFYTNSVGTALTLYNGTRNIITDSLSPFSYRLRENGLRNIQTYDLNMNDILSLAIDFTDANNYWNTMTDWDLAANDVHFGAEKAFDYYYNVWGRLSFDNMGSPVKSYVHMSQYYANAYWDGDELVYGDGDSMFYGPVTSLDIVGHEFTHAVTQYTAGLVYMNESGALNESFSDIFGVTIDYYTNPNTANFLMGDQITINGAQPFRNMANPHLTGQPKTYLGYLWEFTAIDNGGVHTNSQVQNYWYYLLCQGGSGYNDNGVSFTISSIGMDKASSIAYRTLSAYLTPNAQYADARTYSIQAAVDLYGACSNEVIQVTNAWNAVGVGNAFNNAVIADFVTNDTFNCTVPASVSFLNQSINATDFLWSFGDGDTSIALNPSHSYASAGIYTVTLHASEHVNCNTDDTMVKINYISVANIATPLPAICIPLATNPDTSHGIIYIRMDTINRASGNASEGYVDFCCTDRTTLTSNTQYLMQVTKKSNQDSTQAWIDFNNNGSFDISEKFTFFSQSNDTQFLFIHIPVSAVVLNIPLRLRVISDNGYTTDACTPLLGGQAEDYTVLVKHADAPPIAHFISSDTFVSIGSTVSFIDLSIGAATWSWTTPGGIPGLTTVQNPHILFNNLGDFNVKLKVSNSFGSDSISRVIHVVDTFIMCSPSSTQNTSALSGILYDSGGPNGDYQPNENCFLRISPGPCTDSIVLTFSSFNVSSGNLRVYDGSDINAPLLLYADANNAPTTVTATSGHMLICWFASWDPHPGFGASWTSYLSPSVVVNADFSFTPVTPVLQDTIHFTDMSSGNPILWYWDFGDGFASTQQNPTHAYMLPGAYPVRLTVLSCASMDTMTQIIQTQSSPHVSFTPSSLYTALGCDDTTNMNLIISNNAGGDLMWHNDTSWTDAHLFISPDAGYLPAGTVDTINVRISSHGLNGGTNILPAILNTNDTAHLSVNIPIYVTVTDLPCVNFGIGSSDCSAMVFFTDSTTNYPVSWHWDFGDGTTDTIQNPLHTYSVPGIYSVKLVASNTWGVDSTYNVVTINNLSGPAPLSCILNTTTSYPGLGITEFQLDTLHNSSNDATAGYEDFSCNIFTYLTIGQQYYIAMHGAGYYQLYAMLIDTNNDGYFASDETFLYTGGTSASAYIAIPPITNIDMPLRMRLIAEEYNGSTIPLCGNIAFGQAEDYTVIFTYPIPYPDFIPTSYYAYPGDTIQLLDFSLHDPTSWEWTINGAQPSSSIQQSPFITYAAPGVYDVKLKVSNSHGIDSITRYGLITILDTVQTSVEYIANDFMEVYPNPFNKEMNLIVNGDISVSALDIYITNTLGQKIECKKRLVNNKVILLNTEHLMPGAYILEVNYKGEKRYKKLLKK